MGSRGTDPHVLDREENRPYRTVGYIKDAEILEGKNRKYHALPEVSHTPNVIYVKLNDDGTFRELRVFRDSKLMLEIGYHGEKINKGRLILHAHDIRGQEYKDHPEARHLTEEEWNRYKDYFVGLNPERIEK